MNYEEALGVLKREQVDGITLDMNLMRHEWIPRGDRSYESAYKLLELANQMDIPIIILTRFAGSVDDKIYDRFRSLKRIIFKDEIWENRLQQALEKHILSSKSSAPLPRKILRKAVQSVLHYRFGSQADLERAEPIERLADALQKISQEIAEGLRNVTLQVFEEYTKSCEEFELEIKGLSSPGALRKGTTASITEHILLCVEAKYEKEPNVNDWRPPFWSPGTLVEQLWPPKFERFKWWLVMNAVFGPYDRSRMEAALKVLLSAPGRTFTNYQNNGLNELLDEVDERRDRWLII
jgi:hypothetical protein